MKDSEWLSLCAYAGGIWDRDLTPKQKAAGYKLLGHYSEEVVGEAITQIANAGVERFPPWPVVVKQAQAVFEQQRDEQQRALPAGDTLSDDQHRHAMFELRARQTPEQRRRADRMSSETKHSPMQVRIRIATSLLIPPYSRVDPGSWDRLFEQRLTEEAVKLQSAPEVQGATR